MYKEYFVISLFIILLFICCYCSSAKPVEQETASKNDNTVDHNGTNIYYDNLCVGNINDFSSRFDYVDRKAIGYDDPSIKNGDVFNETMDHLLNYVGTITELKSQNSVCNTSSKIYYHLSLHTKLVNKNPITFFVLYPQFYDK